MHQHKLILDKPYSTYFRISGDQYNLPVGLFALWSIQDTNFQKEHDFYTLSGLLRFLGWYIYFDELSDQSRYLVNILRNSPTFMHLLISNVVPTYCGYLPLFWILLHSIRDDLRSSKFDLYKVKGIKNFSVWIASHGISYHENFKIYLALSGFSTMKYGKDIFSIIDLDFYAVEEICNSKASLVNLELEHG